MLIEANVKAALEIDGYALLREYCPSVSSLPVFEELGEIDTVEGLSAIQHLTPKEVSDASPNTYSGKFGTSSFPLHTDLAHWARPPRFHVAQVSKLGLAQPLDEALPCQLVLQAFEPVGKLIELFNRIGH